jgi:hypothetical protein
MAETRNARLITKRTSVPGKIPTGTTGNELNYIKSGELASNLADHSLWGYDGADVFEYGSNSFFGLTGGTITGDTRVIGNFSADTLFSGSTDVETIIRNLISSDTHTFVQPGSNIITGGTAQYPIVSVVDSPFFNGLTASGDTSLQATTATTVYIEDYIQFNTGATPGATVEGKMQWDENNGTVSIGMHSGEVELQVGQETHYYVRNNSGATIQNGRAVRASGTLGASGRILAEYMIADGSVLPKFTLGLSTQDILNGNDGYVTEFGLVRGLNTTGTPYGETWSDGDILWVSTTIEGGLTNVQPVSPNYKIEMGIVILAHIANGSIFVRPHRYPFLSDLQDIGISGGTESNLDIIQWNGATNLWEATSSPTLNSLSATTLSATTLYSGSTNVETIIRDLITGEDTYITGATLSADTTLIISRNDGVDITTDFSIQRAISFNAEEFALDSATRVTLTPITISTVRFAGVGTPDVAGIGFTVPDDYKNGGKFSYIWRSSTTSTTLSAKTSYNMYTGNSTSTGSLVTAAESFSISDTPESTANVFIYSPSYTPTTVLSAGMKIHLTVTRDPGDAGDTLNSDLDMTDFVFTYNALR